MEPIKCIVTSYPLEKDDELIRWRFLFDGATEAQETDKWLKALDAIDQAAEKTLITTWAMYC